MSFHRLSLASILFLTFALSVIAQTEISQKDRAFIVNVVLYEAEFLGFKPADSDVFLSMDELPKGFKPKKNVVKLFLITAAELDKHLTSNSNFLYFKFRKIVRKDTAIIVDFGRYLGGYGYYSAHGRTWEFWKVGRKWKWKQTTGWAKGHNFKLRRYLSSFRSDSLESKQENKP